MKSANPSLPDGWRLEAEVVLAWPSPAAADVARARAAMDHAVRLTPEDPRLLALRGLVLAAAGDGDGARAALEEAQRRNGRLAAVAALRARLR